MLHNSIWWSLHQGARGFWHLTDDMNMSRILWVASRKLCAGRILLPLPKNEEVAPVVDTSATLPVAAHAAGVGTAIHIAGGSRTIHASSTGSNVVNLLQICQSQD